MTSDLLYKEEVYEIIGACMDVHRELGSGFLEAVYQEALMIELKRRNIPFEANVKLNICYKGYDLNKVYFADLVCYDKIVLEIKAINALVSENSAQVINYLKATGFQLGLLVNFGAKSLQSKRLVYTNH